MKARHIKKYAVITITVLTASLLSEWIISKATDLYKDRTYLSVLIGMVVTVVVFVPLFAFMGKHIKRFSKEYMRSSNRVGGNSAIGAIILFALAFGILFVLFAINRHGLDPWKDLTSVFN